MLIRIIPETDAERERVQEVERNVKSFMIFGTEIEEDGDLKDFHDWDGQYMELIGKSHYYSVLLENEFAKKGSRTPEMRLAPPSSAHQQMKKTGEAGDIEVIPQEEINKLKNKKHYQGRPDLKIIEARNIETEAEEKETDVFISAEETTDD